MNSVPQQATVALLTEQQGNVLHLILNRSTAHNCLSSELIALLQAALDAAELDSAVHVIVISANGPSFCGGHDFEEYQAHGDPEQRRIALLASNDMMLTLVASPKATIACVDGLVAGAGLELVAGCDLAYASERATFCTRGIEIGLWDHSAQVALSRRLSRRHAMEMLLTAADVDAADALRTGLVNRVFPAADIEREVTQVAQTIAAKSSYTVSLGKDSYDHQASMGRHEAYEYISDQFYRDVQSDDAAEGIAAALENRAPHWKGR